MSAPESYLKEIKINSMKMLPCSSTKDCKSVLNIGIFFDGTDNNIYSDSMKRGHSNVARLYNIYRNESEKGYFKHYIQGVGTKFPAIGEDVVPFSGGPWGKGGEPRIVYALLQVLVSVYLFLMKGGVLFSDSQILALVSESTVNLRSAEMYPYELTPQDVVLAGMGLSSGLVGDPDSRDTFLRVQASKIRDIVNGRKVIPNISGIYLDVFGFSRGAAQARVFCNWLYKSLLIKGEMFGVPAYVRMLGLFDTVASVGFSKSGHSNWATFSDLQIHGEIKNCLHYVAAHEFRNNFPLDSVCVDGKLKPNCFEQIGLGSHSDIGGGYEPGEQGKGVVFLPKNGSSEVILVSVENMEEGDRNKLSQLPLNLMLNNARASCSNHGVDGNPWLDLEGDDSDLRGLSAEFECNPQLREMVAKYFSQCGVKPGLPVELAVCEHNAVYMAWRHSVAKKKGGFQQLASVRYANAVDSERVKYYMRGEEYFSEQLEELRSLAGAFGNGISKESEYTKRGYHRQAGEIYQKIQKILVPIDVAVFFDMYVHDSYAGFIGKFKDGMINSMTHRIAEPKRYLTYRGVYQGNDVKLNAQQGLLDTYSTVA